MMCLQIGQEQLGLIYFYFGVAKEKLFGVWGLWFRVFSMQKKVVWCLDPIAITFMVWGFFGAKRFMRLTTINFEGC